MRTLPNRRDESDMKDLEKLKAEKWQIDLLAKNHGYVWWGNYEGYMSDKDSRWRSPTEVESPDDLWGLDDYNEVVNFYFELNRKHHNCPHCDGQGINKETKQLSDDRAKHLGVYGECEHCDHGTIYDEDFATVGLQLWYLHPRKGASRGLYVKNIIEKDIPKVVEYLKGAAERNTNRFSKL